MKEEVKKQDPVEAMIATQLERFEVKEEDLKEKVAQYSQLVVTGVADKAGRKAVSEARKDLKFIRTGITGTGKDLRENFTKVTKAIIAREKDLISITLPEEQRLEQIESDIAEEEEDIRKQKEHEEQERIIARTKILEGYGATFNGVQYQLGDNTITMAEVRLFTDTEFNRASTFFKEDYENFEQLKLQAEIANKTAKLERKEGAIQYLNSFGYIETSQGYLDQEILHLAGKFDLDNFESLDELDAFKIGISTSRNEHIRDREEKEKRRIADESLKAEQAKLAEIAAQQKAQQEELDRKKKELDDQLKAIQAEKDKQLEDARKLELAAKVSRFNLRKDRIKTFFPLSYEEINNINNEIYTISDEDFETRFNEELQLSIERQKQQEEKLAKQAEEAAAAEEKRRIEMAPDVDILKQLVVDIKGSIVMHKMKSEKGTAVINNINSLKSKIVSYIEEQIKSL